MFIIVDKHNPIDATTRLAYSSRLMNRNPFIGVPFASRILAFRDRHKLTQAQCAALIPHLSVRSLEKWERNTSCPPLWSQCLILDALHDAMISD